MKHAGPKALDELESLLSAIRKMGVLKERTRGVFYFKSQAFLHFHEDPAGYFADIRGDDDDFDRLRVSTSRERKQFLKYVNKRLQSLGAK